MRFLLALAGGIALGLAGMMLHLAAAGGPVDTALRDLAYRTRGPVPVPDSVALVDMDDASLAAQGGWPLSRDVLARAIDALSAQGAAVIAVDLLLVEPAVGDEALARAVSAAGNVVLPVALSSGTETGPVDGAALVQAAERIVLRPPCCVGPGTPLSALRAPPAAVRAGALLGHAHLSRGLDGGVRGVPAALAVAGHHVPALAVAAARRAEDDDPAVRAIDLSGRVFDGSHWVATTARLDLPVAWYGSYADFRRYRLDEVLTGGVPPDALAGRIVFLGATATGAGDHFATPFDPAMPGHAVHATLAANLAAGDTPAAVGPGPLAATLAAAAAAGLLLVLLPGPAVALAGLALALAALWAVATALLAGAGIWLAPLGPGAVLATAGVTSLLFVARRRARKGARSEAERLRLARYVPAPVAAGMAAEEDLTQTAAILFVDLVGFTALSERISPQETARLLRAFHGAVERSVDAHGGVIEAYIGDGVMAMFGVPVPRADDPVRALACARDLHEALGRWSAARLAAGEKTPSYAMGLHMGPVAVGALGGEHHRQLSVAGDAVNVASRIEGLTRVHGTAIAVSEVLAATVESAGRPDLLEGFRQVGPQHLKGRAAPVAVRVWP